MGGDATMSVCPNVPDDSDRLSKMAFRRPKVADLTEHRPEGDPRAHLAGPVAVSLQGATRCLQRRRGAAEVAPPVQHQPAVDHRPRPLGSLQHGRGRIEQIATHRRGLRGGRRRWRASSSARQRVRRRRRRQRGRRQYEARSAAASRSAELALGDADRPLQPSAIGKVRRIALLAPNRLVAYADRIGLDVVTKLRHAHRVERAPRLSDAIRGSTTDRSTKSPAPPERPRHNGHMRNDEPPDSPSRSVKDHPAPLGALTEIFDRRNIAVGIDSAGQVVLARPNTVLAASRR